MNDFDVVAPVSQGSHQVLHEYPIPSEVVRRIEGRQHADSKRPGLHVS